MSLAAIRIFVFTFLPVLMAGGLVAFDKRTRGRERTIEIFLIYLFSIGVAGAGISNFIAHVFISDIVAESIGWPAGSPFQLEVGFANLAIGVLGLVAASRRDGFREATVIAATAFSVGATVVHAIDIVQTGNLAPGNTVQNISNLLRPAFLIGFLVASRRLERSHGREDPEAFDAWRQPRLLAAGVFTGVVATGFGVGFAVGQPALATGLAVLVGIGVTALILRRAG
jgi:hypothetical protein